MEDKLLIWKFKHGSSDALCRIYEKYEDYMLTSAISLLNDLSSAEDVVHDVFVSFSQSADKLRLNGNLKGYLMTCVVNLARDKIRATQRHRLALDKMNHVSSDSKQPSDSIIGDEELQQLISAMAQLPHEQREAIVLHLRGSMRFKAIARLQGVSINTVQSRYRYGLDKLRSLLDSEVEK
ncbi:MAG TPA: sigma-70 family RNA polymerase sigma factor [Planctomycetes bacterium]|nr:sigma-70 family RNA polymerase sigma factor [Planctomycetota bacterium]